MARKSRRTQRLRVVNPDCAGIDIGKDRHFVAVDPERTEEPVRSFGAFTRDLEEMAAWLASCGVTKVAMESTSVYWIPVYETLERAGFEVMLVPPRMTKQIGGRKSDVLDCQWIWQLMSYGLLRGAFRPGDEVCPLRSYARQMRRLTGDRSRCVLHMQKALTEMNVKLDSVIANIVGLTGQRILRAIIDGERDPERLATLRHRGIKADADTIAASLQGTWREEHLFALEQAMQRYDFLTQQIDDCEARVMAEIERLTPPDDLPDGGAPDHAPGTTSETASSRSANAASNYTGKEGIQALALRGMMGVDLTAIPTIGPGTALVIASEIGPDFSAFPSAQHFCSWLALAPGTRISGGKNLPGKSPKAVNPVGQALRMAAMAARRSETFIVLTGVECRPLIVGDINMLARRSASNRRADQQHGEEADGSGPAPGIWLFSSTHSTRARSGGLRYSPTMSRTFSTNSGSDDSLNVSERCGCRPKACQIR